MIDTESINHAAELLKNANHMLIWYESRLSAAVELDYTDTKLFAELFPGLTQKGHWTFYSMFCYSDWSEAEKWGYLANQVNCVSFHPNPHPVYLRLLDLLKDKNYFVITSNVDGMFIRNGFNAQKIFTSQGEYSCLQCLTPW